MSNLNLPNRNRRCAAAVAGAAVVGLLLGGCGLQPAASYTPDSSPGSIQPIESLPDGAELTVVSKNFTEQLILGKIAVLTAQAAGFTVTDLANVPGSQLLPRRRQRPVVWPVGPWHGDRHCIAVR